MSSQDTFQTPSVTYIDNEQVAFGEIEDKGNKTTMSAFIFFFYYFVPLRETLCIGDSAFVNYKVE